MAQTPPDIGDYGNYAGWGAAALIILYFLRDKLFPFWAERRKAEQVHDQQAEDVILRQVLDTQKDLIGNLIQASISQRDRIEEGVHRSVSDALRLEQQDERDKEVSRWIQRIDEELTGHGQLLEELKRLLLEAKEEPGIRDTQEGGKGVS